MEQPTSEQQRRRERAEEINQGVEDGTITSVANLDPRDTSIEHIQTVRQRLQALGRGTLRQTSGL